MEYVIVINTNANNWFDYIEQFFDWCDQNCTGEYDVRVYHMNEIEVSFKKEQDAILFALTWC